MNGEVRFTVRNLRQFRDELRKADSDRIKAAETAVKVEGYRLMIELRKELRAGKAGNTTLAPLRYITASRRSASSKPLASLARAVRYATIGKGATLKAMFGFLAIKSSWSWIRIAERQQEGFTTSADALSAGESATVRQSFVRRGAKLSRRSSLRRYFFLRKTTRQLTTPARNIIEPFWVAHQREAERNIINNFRRKMAGERI